MLRLTMLNLFFRRMLCVIALTSFARAAPEVAAGDGARKEKHAAEQGSVAGVVVDPDSHRPLEFVAVTLKRADGAVVQSTVTDNRGRFTLEKVPTGSYAVVYNQVGADAKTTLPFTVDAQHLQFDLGNLSAADDAVKMEKFEVRAKQDAQLNAIDRKTYNVGKEIQSTTGSASDLLQNIPSVSVDIDGNVSLRGSDNVLILVNGRTSALMGKSRAEVLQQLPADLIDKIEVITNPSTKYKPDGTAGIINIALKRKHEGGSSGTANFSVGNDSRYNAGLTANYRPGPFNIFGGYSVRQDDRLRTATDIRTFADPVTGVVTRAEKRTVEHSRPFFRLARAGIDWSAGEHDQFGLTGNFSRRTFLRLATDHNISRDAAGAVTTDFDRTRRDPELEQEAELNATWQHTFEEGHELNFELKASAKHETEDNHFADIFRTPAQATTFDNTRIQPHERGSEAIVEYVRPLDGGAKFEAGYTRTTNRLDADFFAESLDLTSGVFVRDAAQSNRFIYDETIHAFYATYARTFGRFGFLAGVRPELTAGKSLLVNTGVTVPNDYTRIYPSLHLTYRLTDEHELQLNYSHRVHRPESDDLNPFPEFADPFTLRAGNPHLLPEDIHSVEAGYSFRHADTSFTSTVYHRYLYHGFTSVTRAIGNGVLFSTRENLAVNRSTGLELTANTELGRLVTLNFSSNTFFNTIDASNLGFSGNKSDISWLAKAGATLHLPHDTLLQFNANYSSARLTPQGERRPSFVANAGLRHDLWKKKAALVLTVSDIFNSLREASVFDTPALREEITRRRSSRIVYLGFVYNFGQPSKKSKDDLLKFDNSL